MANVDDLDLAELQADFGGVSGIGLILANPELLLLAYQSQGWTNAKIVYPDPNDPTKFEIEEGEKEEGVEWEPNKIAAEVTNTDWYKTNDGNLRLADNAKNTDPATWATQLDNVKGSIIRKATERGANLEGFDVDKMAENVLRNNYTYISKAPDGEIPDSVLDSYLTPLVTMNANGDFRGAAQTSAAQLRSFAEKYGVAMSDQWYASAIQGLDQNTINLVDLQTEIVNNARETWPTLDGISLTKSTYDIADSYMQRMANVLEMDVDTINLETPEIKNALVSKDADGNPIRRTMWEFEQDLRMDPRWETTKQGQQELSDASMRMLKEFGFYE